jgi:ribonuclease BN (tRNA processing enzyme)
MSTTIASPPRLGVMPLLVDRRRLLAAAALFPFARPAVAQSRGDTRVVLLGTKGGPTPGPIRAQPATAIIVDGHCYLVDCGNGVAQQMAKAGIALPSIDQVFVTHDHSDHVIDVGTLMVLAWGSGLAHPITVHGPPPIAAIMRNSIAASEYDIAIRMREEGRPPLAPLVKVEERSAAGPVFRDERVTVSSTLVDHYGVKPAFAYRFETPGRSVVISGDTTYSPALVALAKGADLLVHEAMYAPAIRAMAPENAPGFYDHLLHSHSTTQQAGRVAAEAGVRKLVLTHLVPGNPAITDDMWLAGVRERYHGEAVVGRDLMEV